MTQVKSLDEAKMHIDSLVVRVGELERRLRHTEDRLDTLSTRLWKRVVFRLDGWPPWWIVTERPAWRPWRRWFKS